MFIGLSDLSHKIYGGAFDVFGIREAWLQQKLN
jgi:hypothetical protein